MRKIESQLKSQTVLIVFLCLISLGLISCGGDQNNNPNAGRYELKHDRAPSENVDVSQIPNAVPRYTKRSRSGNPKSYVVFGKRYHVLSSAQGYKKRGLASWYGKKFHGKRTSSGEPYDMHAMTAAHKTLPLPSYVKVTNLKNGRQIIVKVNDRGPFHQNRIIDLSHTAAVKLGIKGTGTGLVEVETVTAGQTITPVTQKVTTRTLKPLSSHQSAVGTSQPAVGTNQSTIGMYLQSGAFLNSNNAEKLKDRVNSTLSFNQAHVSTTQKNGQQFYRVRIGPISSTEKIDQLSQALTEKGFPNHQITIE